MTLEQAIQHCKEVAIKYEAKGECYECGKEHRQLAEWLEDYKRLKEHFDSLRKETAHEHHHCANGVYNDSKAPD